MGVGWQVNRVSDTGTPTVAKTGSRCARLTPAHKYGIYSTHHVIRDHIILHSLETLSCIL